MNQALHMSSITDFFFPMFSMFNHCNSVSDIGVWQKLVIHPEWKQDLILLLELLKVRQTLDPDLLL